MLTNSSSVLLPSIAHTLSYCYKMSSSKYHIIASAVVNVPTGLPLCLYILHAGVQRWRSGAKISHTDFFTYNVVVILLLGILGSCLLIINVVIRSDLVVIICVYMLLINSSAVVFFQIFTCLERYLAVVHPVTYLSLKSRTWFIIRNVCCEFVWLHCIIQSLCFSHGKTIAAYICFCLTVLSVFVLLVLFCNLSVLHALIRPAPGEGGRGNHSKCRALYMISAITGTILVKFVGETVGLTSFVFSDSIDEACMVCLSVMWLSLPSNLVLPMLFLHRNGKLLCFKTNK